MEENIIKEKIVYLGFHKTATSSFQSFLEQLGYSGVGNYKEWTWEGDTDVESAMIFSEKYNVFADSPWFKLYKNFDLKYPNTKYIIWTRDTDSWYESVLNFLGSDNSSSRRWIYGELYGSPVNNEKIYKLVYEQHISEVFDYFKDRPNDFLHLENLDDAAKKVTKFLNKNNEVEFPHIRPIFEPYDVLVKKHNLIGTYQG